MPKSSFVAVEYHDVEFDLVRSISVTSQAEIPEKSNSKDDVPEATTAPSSMVEGLNQLQESFFNQLHSYMDGLPSLVAMAPLIQNTNYSWILKKAKDKLFGEEEIKRENWRFFEIPQENVERFYREQAQATRRANALSNMPEMVLLGAVSQFDSFLGQLLRILLDRRPDIVSSSQKTFAAHEVLKYTDMSAFKDAVIEKTIEDFLRKSHEKQFIWLEEQFGLKLRNDLHSWARFIETFERRNLFAHSNGVVSQSYLIKCAEAGLDPLPKLGETLSASPKYLQRSLQVFAEIGIKLIQVLGRKLAKTDEELVAFDKSLNACAYELIEHAHYSLAKEILKFGLSLPKHPDETMKMMMEVNLANSLALQGDVNGANVILEKRQWKACSIDFQICVGAIRSDAEEVAKLMPQFFVDYASEEWCFRHWPVFAHVRESADFQEAYKKRFDKPFVPAFEVKTKQEQKQEDSGSE